MKSQDQLFELITTMTKHEKRYFKTYSSLHAISKVNIYVLLFDVIAKQNEYDEKAIKQLVKKSINSSNFRKVKNYLYKQLLKCLSSYSAYSTAKLKLKKNIHFAEILFNKALYRQCNKILSSAEKIAVTNNFNELHLEIKELQLKAASVNKYAKSSDAIVSEYYKDKNEIVGRIQNTITYEELNRSFYALYYKNRYVKNLDQIKNIFGNLINHPFIQNQSNADSPEKLFYFYNILALYNYLINKLDDSRECVKKQFFLLENNQEFSNAKPDLYLNTLHNLIFSNIEIGSLKEASSLINKFSLLKVRALHLEIKKFTFFNRLKLEMLIKTQRHKEAILIVPDIEKGLKKYEGHISLTNTFFFYINIASIYITLGEFKKALFWVNKIINNPSSRAEGATQFFSRILNLVIHYELNSLNHLPYFIQSAYRFLLKQEHVFLSEKIFFKYVEKLPRAINENQLKNVFIDFKDEINNALKNPYEKRFFEFFDILNWIESKIQNRPMIEILKEKGV